MISLDFLDAVVPSLPRGHDMDSSGTAPVVRQVRLTQSIALGLARPILRARDDLRPSRGPSQSALGRPARRVRGVYAGLSNTRFHGRVRKGNR